MVRVVLLQSSHAAGTRTRPARRRFLRLTALHLFLIGLVAEAAPVRPGMFVVASYNLENYLSMDRRLEDGWRPDYPKPEGEKTALRACIRAAGADLIALQEIGGAGYVEELRLDLAAEGLDYPYAACAEGPDPVRRIAVLSNRPFLDVRIYDELVFPYLDGEAMVKRGLLRVDVDAPGGSVAVYVIHLKSRWTDDPRDPRSLLRRTREAEAVRRVILENHPDPARERFLVLGDVNDTIGSAPVRRLLTIGGREVTRAVEARDSRGHLWTHFFAREGVYSIVDYILASPRWLDDFPSIESGIIDIPEADAASDHRLIWAAFGGTPRSGAMTKPE